MAKTKMLHTIAHVETKGLSDADKEAGIVRGVIGSSEVLDRAGDVIRQDGWDLKNYMKNKVILWGHNVRQDRPPIGKALKVWLDGKTTKTKKLMFDIQFDLKDSFAAEIYRKVLEGFVNTVSVGFIPLERVDNVYTKNELLELSFVPVPANPDAVVTLRSMGLDPVELKDLYSAKSDDDVAVIMGEESTEESVDEETEEEVADETTDETTDESTEETSEETETSEDESTSDTDETEETEEADTEATDETERDEETESEESDEKSQDDVVSKGVLPYKDLGTAPSSEDWDGPGEMAKATLDDLRVICAYRNHEKADEKNAYFLPHHRVSDKKAVWRGVSSAMAALMGFKGVNGIPEADRRAVYNHLAKHYEEFGRQAPSYKMVEDQVLAQLTDEIHAITLEREDKYAVRLLKKLLKQTKPETKVETKVETTVEVTDEDAAIKALQVIDQALTSVLTRTRAGKE